MDIRQLNYFKTVAEEGNISNAAKKLNMTQPPLSIQIRQLEEELGCLLFERDTRNLKLTDAGQILYEKAQVILDLMRTTHYQFEDIRNGQRGVLNIGVISSVSSTLFMKWLKGYQDLYPQVQIIITENDTYHLLDMLKSKQIDLALVRTPFHEPGFHTQIIKEERLKVIGTGECFGKCTGNEISLEELADMRLLLYRRWEQVVRNKFAEIEKSPFYAIICDDARTVAYAAQNGMGIGVVPESVLPLLDLNMIEVKSVKDSILKTSISLVRRKNEYLPKAVENFLEYMGQK